MSEDVRTGGDNPRFTGGLMWPICLVQGHIWTDGPFMGDDKKCVRCHAHEIPHVPPLYKDPFLIGVVVGMALTILTGVLACVVVL